MPPDSIVTGELAIFAVDFSAWSNQRNPPNLTPPEAWRVYSGAVILAVTH